MCVRLSVTFVPARVALNGVVSEERAVPLTRKSFEFCFWEWRIRIYFIFLSDGGAPKRRGDRENFPLPCCWRAWQNALPICRSCSLTQAWKFSELWTLCAVCRFSPLVIIFATFCGQVAKKDHCRYCIAYGLYMLFIISVTHRRTRTAAATLLVVGLSRR